MRMKTMLIAAAATSLTASPVLAANAAPANPAASLSVAKSVRASAKGEKSSELAGAGIVGAILAAGIIAIPVIAIINDSDDSDSN